MPPFKQAKKLFKDLERDPKADPETKVALARSIAIMERTKGDNEKLIEEFMRTRDMAHAQPLVWLNLAEHVRKTCGEKNLYRFNDFAIEGKLAFDKVKGSIGTKSDMEKKMAEEMAKVFEKKETFSTMAHQHAANDASSAADKTN